MAMDIYIFITIISQESLTGNMCLEMSLSSHDMNMIISIKYLCMEQKSARRLSH